MRATILDPATMSMGNWKESGNSGESSGVQDGPDRIHRRLAINMDREAIDSEFILLFPLTSASN